MNFFSPQPLLRTLAGVCVLVALQGCEGAIWQAVHGDGLAIVAEKKGEEIRFHIIGGDGEAMIIEGLSVSSVRSDQTRGEYYWSVEHDSSVPFDRRIPVVPPIIFGQTPVEMLTRVPARLLIPGEYVVDGYAVFAKPKSTGGLRMDGRFFVLGDGKIELPVE